MVPVPVPDHVTEITVSYRITTDPDPSRPMTVRDAVAAAQSQATDDVVAAEADDPQLGWAEGQYVYFHGHWPEREIRRHVSDSQDMLRAFVGFLGEHPDETFGMDAICTAIGVTSLALRAPLSGASRRMHHRHHQEHLFWDARWDSTAGQFQYRLRAREAAIVLDQLRYLNSGRPQRPDAG
jgi:hypothetical protein